MTDKHTLLIELVEQGCIENFNNKLNEINDDKILTKKFNTNNFKEGNLFHCIAISTSKKSPNEDLQCWISIAQKIIDKLIQLNYFLFNFINAKDKHGNTPLHYAIGDCKPDFVLFLIKYGAIILLNSQDKSVFDLVKELNTPKKALYRADGIIKASDSLLSLPLPSKFSHISRFSLTTAYVLGLLSRIAYKGSGSDDKDDEKSGNDITHAFLYRWGFRNSIIYERNSARAIVTEFTEINNDSDKKQTVRIVAFRGSKTTKDYIADATSTFSYNGKCIGFYNHLKKISNLLIETIKKRSKMPLYVTGHSLGGAMSSLFLMELKELSFDTKNKIFKEKYPGDNNLSLYSFGQPRPGDTTFLTDFNKYFSNNVYIIQRHDDVVPLVPLHDWGFRHCGALRYIDEEDQLALDSHYKLHDIRRMFNDKVPDINNANVCDIREAWTEGLKFLQKQEDINKDRTEPPELPTKDEWKKMIEEEMNEDKIKQEYSSSKLTKHNKKKKNEIRRKVFSNIITGILLRNPLSSKSRGIKEAHGMQTYLDSINSLLKKMSSQYTGNTSAISSFAEKLRISQELWNDYNKKKSIECNISYTNWVNKYITISGFSITIDKCFGTSKEWILKEGKILESIKQCVNDIIKLYNENTIQYKTEYTNNIDKELLLYHLSPLVLHGIQYILYLVSQYENKPGIRDKIISIISKLYYNLPEDSPILSCITKEQMLKETNLTRNIIDSTCIENIHNESNIKQNNIGKGKLSVTIERISNPNKSIPCILKKNFCKFLTDESNKTNNKFVLSIANHIKTLPHKNGYRLNVEKEYNKWNTTLRSLIVLKKPNSEKDYPYLKIIIDNEIQEGYLNPIYKPCFDVRKETEKKIPGRRFVYTLGKEFYIKEYPELPGLERASEIFAKLFLGEGIPCSTIGRIEYETAVIPILISQSVGTHNLQDYQSDNKIMSNFHPKIYSELIILQLLTLIEDAKPDNFQISKCKNTDFYNLYSVDNDHCFVPAFIKKIGRIKLNFKSILFFCDDIKNPIHPVVKQQLKFINFELLLEKWLQELNILDKLCVGDNALFSYEEEIEIQKKKTITEKLFSKKKEETGTIIRPMFADKMVEEMYGRMIKLRNQLKSSNKVSHEDLFIHLLPTVSKIYLKSFINYKTPYDRFKKITRKYYDENHITNMTGDDILKSAKIKTSIKHSPEIQLAIIRKIINKDGKYTKKASYCLNKSDEDGFKKAFTKLDSIHFQENFLDIQAQDIILSKNKGDRDKIGNIICNTLFNMTGFTKLNLSNIDSFLIPAILTRNRITLENVILRNCNIPSLGGVVVGNLMFLNQKQIERDYTHNKGKSELNSVVSFVKENPLSSTIIVADYVVNNSGRDHYRLRNLKHLDVTGCTDITGLAGNIPNLRKKKIFKPYKTKGLLDLYHTNRYKLKDIMEFSINTISNIKIISDFGFKNYMSFITNTSLSNIKVIYLTQIYEYGNSYKFIVLTALQKYKNLKALKFSTSDTDDVKAILSQIQLHTPKLVSLYIAGINKDSCCNYSDSLKDLSIKQLILDGTRKLYYKQSYINDAIKTKIEFLVISPYIIANYTIFFNSLKDNNSLISLSFQSNEFSNFEVSIDEYEDIETELKDKPFERCILNIDDFLEQLMIYLENNNNIKYLSLINIINEEETNQVFDKVLDKYNICELTIIYNDKIIDISPLINGTNTSLYYPKCDITQNNYNRDCIPLIDSIKYNNLNQVKQLLNGGNINPYIHTYDGKSILDIATNTEIKEYLIETYPLLEVLDITKGLTGFHPIIELPKFEFDFDSMED